MRRGCTWDAREAWRAGEINAETAQAFAVCRDRDRQAKVFADLRKQRRLWPHEVRQHFGKDKPRLNDPRVAFIGGLEAYRAAGGQVVESLFKDDGYLENGELLEQLVSERISAKCAELEAEGWSFALPVSEVKGQAHWSWQKLRPGEVKHTPEETTRLKELDAEEDGLEALDVLDDEQRARADAIYDERERIEAAATTRASTKAQKGKSGCIVDGDSIMYGLVRPKAGKAAAATQPGQDGHQEEDGAGELGDGDLGAEHDEDGAPHLEFADAVDQREADARRGQDAGGVAGGGAGDRRGRSQLV
jgi:ParB family chromosome partitioning protein